MKKIIKLIPLMLILVLALTSCQKNAENSGKPKVYTSFYAMYNFAKTIGGDDIDLTNICKVYDLTCNSVTGGCFQTQAIDKCAQGQE